MMRPSVLAVIPRDYEGIIRVAIHRDSDALQRHDYTFEKAKEAHVYTDGQVVVIGEAESAVAYFPACVAPVVTSPLKPTLASA